MVRKLVMTACAGIALSAAAAQAAPVADLTEQARIVAADEARVKGLENELVSIEQEFDSAAKAKPVDKEALECARESRDGLRANLTAARKQLATDRAALASAEKGKGTPRLATESLRR